MNKLATFFAAALCAVPAVAQEIDYLPVAVPEPRELRPEYSVFEKDAGQGFEQSIIVFADFKDFLYPMSTAMAAYTDDIKNVPAQEFAVGLREQAGIKIVGASMSVPMVKLDRVMSRRRLFETIQNNNFAVTDEELAKAERENAALRKQLIEDRQGRKLVECAIAIDQARADRIATVWRAMLLRTRPPLADSYYPGTNAQRTALDYHFFSDYMTAQAIYPVTTDKPGVMAALGTAMFDYCQTKQPEALSRMDAKLVELEGLLAKDGVKP